MVLLNSLKIYFKKRVQKFDFSLYYQENDPRISKFKNLYFQSMYLNVSKFMTNVTAF